MEDLYRSQFRLPYPLYERLAEAARVQGRSLNAEIVARLQQTFEEPPSGTCAQEEVRMQIAQVTLALGERMGQMEAGLKSYVDEAVACLQRQKQIHSGANNDGAANATHMTPTYREGSRMQNPE